MTRFSMVFLKEEDKAEVFHAENGKQGKRYDRLKKQKETLVLPNFADKCGTDRIL